MALHKDLTGAELHEPKGADTAGAGTVYEADGSGSGTWKPRLSGIANVNKYWVSGNVPDVSTPGSRVYLYAPVASSMFEISAVLNGPITTANATLSIYVNGVLHGEALTIPFAGSSAGQVHKRTLVLANSVAAGAVIEIRSDGASDTVASAFVTLGLTATV